jgi:hypothetical protein
MSYEEHRTVVEQPTMDPAIRTSRRVSYSPSPAEIGRRIVVLIIGIIQILIALRFILLLVDAQRGNAIVRFILDASEIFVAPFEGILRTNALQAGGSVLDVTAIVAFIGWTILELIILWALNVARREPVAV